MSKNITAKKQMSKKDVVIGVTALAVGVYAYIQVTSKIFDLTLDGVMYVTDKATSKKK